MNSASTLVALLSAPSIIQAAAVVPVTVAGGLMLVVPATTCIARRTNWAEPAAA